MIKTPREAGEAAFYECEGNTQACLKAAFDAYEATTKPIRDDLVRALENLSWCANAIVGASLYDDDAEEAFEAFENARTQARRTLRLSKAEAA